MRLALVIVLGLAMLGLAGAGIYRAVRKGAPPPVPVAPEPTTAIPVANREIKPGEIIRKEDILEKPVPNSQLESLPADALRASKEVAGGTATQVIAKDAWFTRAQMIPPPESLSAKVDPGYVAVTVQTPPVPSLYDLKFLQPDDRVDVFGVQKGAGEEQTVSVLLAANVRLLAVDAVFDKYQEEQRIAELDAAIAAKKVERDKAAATGLPDATKNVDAEIAALEAQKNAKPENPSVTVELTPEQAQYVALWKNQAAIEVALHRKDDGTLMAAGVEALATPAQMASLAGAAEPLVTPVLTLDDVVPLRLRSTRAHSERLRSEEEILRMPSQRRVQNLQDEVEAARLRTELRNWERYGASTPPVEVPTFGPIAPVTGGGPDLTGLRDVLTEMQRDIRELKGNQAPAPYRQRVDVIRGTDVEVVES